MQNEIEKFLILFNRLENILKHSLKNLQWLPDAKPKIAEVCYQLDQVYCQLNRSFLTQSMKSSIVNPIFQERWDKFLKYYKTKVQEVAKPVREKHNKEFSELLDSTFEKNESKGGQSKEESWQEIVNSVSREARMNFNPSINNAASLLEDIFRYAEDSVDMGGGITDNHLGAMKYFEDVLGLNFSEINYKWSKVPDLFVSENITKKTDKLIEMYYEAAKSYVFGLNVTATAMCRALLEHILINYYGIHEANLAKIINLAEKRFKELKNLDLHKLREDGNNVMHKYQANSKIEDQAVIRNLLTIRSLVGSIPTK